MNYKILIPAALVVGVLIGAGFMYLFATTQMKPAQQLPRENVQAGVHNDIDLAREALYRYLTLLNSKNYAEAAMYYGGDYEVFVGWNPGVDPADHATLFRNACEFNGLNCLKIKELGAGRQISPTEFEFSIEFANEDGTTFEAASPPAYEPSPGITIFYYTVKKVGDSFVVMEFPPYQT